MIFLTFLGSCLCICLLAVSLSTKHWIKSKAKRIPEKPDSDITRKSDGKIYFGLFYGQKELNVGYGWRQENKLLQKEPDFMMYSVWQATKYCMYFALLFSAAAAVFAVVNTAITPVGDITGIPGLYIWNIISMLLQISAVSLWVWQYYRKLRYNVMSADDKKLSWSSDGMSYFGHSLWLVVASIIIQAINVIFIYTGTTELRHKKSAAPVIEEKSNGAIMLY
ncbi:hypothetical protein AAG570_009342 [Ranatra chinensis]|uniref:Uncharacterized protein n=1 Tax=Ranatra chinensis TaxID=642074 RepID=A0ABD0YPC6_9HEMI